MITTGQELEQDMRILVINPNTSTAMSAAIHEECCNVAAPGTEVRTINAVRGPESIESFTEDAVATAALVETVVREKSTFDAVVVACFDDPGLSALREVLDEPVVGIAEAAMHLACLVAPNFSVITPTRRARVRIEETVHRSGLAARCRSIRTVELPVLETESNPDLARELIRAEAKRAIDEDGAEAICLGCAGLGPLDKVLEADLGVPVLDGCGCAVTLAESLLRYDVRTSKVATFAPPPTKPYKDSMHLEGLAPWVK